MDGIALEIFTEIWLPHNGLLASKLGKKASTNLGAIHSGLRSTNLNIPFLLKNLRPVKIALVNAR